MIISYKSPGTLEATRFEKIHSVIFKESKEASKIVANEIADLIRKKQKENKNCVLGLATGSSPISVYNELVRIHKEEGLSFSNVVSYNLDEYFPMSKVDLHESIKINNEIYWGGNFDSVLNLINNNKLKKNNIKFFLGYSWNCKSVSDLELNINPNESDIIIVKIGYLVPELYNINKGWTMALTPGGVDQDLDRLDYKRIKRPMFPLDDFENKPDLSSKLIEISNKN